MVDRGRVIKGLELCKEQRRDCNECPYNDETFSCQDGFLIWDALELLKAQETRILDWDELEDWGNAVWFEDKDENKCYIALIANIGTYDAKFINVEPGNLHSLDFMRDFYMKEWRCWTSKPTDEQRMAVKWDD